MTAIDVYALPASPWKNGGGATRTLAVCPPAAGLDDFDWRVSLAEVASSGEFSRFPGVDRTILLLDGAGMTLHIDSRVVALTAPFEPYRFSGNDGVRSQLVNGPARDFNVMTRRGRARAEVNVRRSDFRWQIGADASIFFCARGVYGIDGAELHAGWALRADRAAAEMCFTPQTPDAVMIAVLVTLEYS
jgi:environmental stress-induced protein Ves